MVNFRQSRFAELLSSDTFLWCTGIEDTFITAPSPKTGRTLDEYELTGHYEQWHSDVGLMAEIGVNAARYGIPWHRINPRPGVWDWQWADRPLERLLELGIAPIVDLVHYGVPPWIDNAFVDPDYPKYVAEYAARTAERFKGRIHAYTPLNEPRITAWYCGRLGWWPPFRRSWRGFVQVMLGVCRGIIRTTKALKEVDPEILAVHVDASDLYTTVDATLAAETQHRQELVFFALDLITGRLVSGHPLHAWLLGLGVTEAELAWFHEEAVTLPLLGVNLYPMFTNKVLYRNKSGASRIRMTYAKGTLVHDIARLYADRYQTPLFISETASAGSIKRRRKWLEDSVKATADARAAGIPLVGYTWWPLFALVTWAYRQGTRPPQEYFTQMGLWDLDTTGARVRTPLVDAYRELTAHGVRAVGPRNHQPAAAHPATAATANE